MMVGGKRKCGKTSKLVKLAHEGNLHIICVDHARVLNILSVAKELELDIPHPITVHELPLKTRYVHNVLVDDIEDVLGRLIGADIIMASTSKQLVEMERIDNGKS